MTTENKKYSVGYVHFIFGDNYGDLVEIFHGNNPNRQNDNYSSYGAPKYNTADTVQTTHFKDYFGDSIHLNAAAFYGVDKTAHVVSKLVRSGFVILVLNLTYQDTFDGALHYAKNYSDILKKYSNDLDVALIIRANKTYTAFKEIDENKDGFLWLLNHMTDGFYKSIDLCEFAYNVRDRFDDKFNRLVNSTVLSYFNNNRHRFVEFDSDPPFIISENYVNRSIYTRNKIEKDLIKHGIENTDEHINKLVRSGYLLNMPCRGIDQYYIKVSSSKKSFLACLFSPYASYSTVTKKIGYNGKRHGHTYYESLIRYSSIIHHLPENTGPKRKILSRLLTTFIRRGRLGRYIGDNLFYLRRYDHNNLTRKKLEFIY